MLKRTSLVDSAMDSVLRKRKDAAESHKSDDLTQEEYF